MARRSSPFKDFEAVDWYITETVTRLTHFVSEMIYCVSRGLTLCTFSGSHRQS